MKCYKCGDGISSGKDFIPVDEQGTPNRRWVCTKCASIVQKQQAKNQLGKEGIRISKTISPNFLN